MRIFIPLYHMVAQINDIYVLIYKQVQNVHKQMDQESSVLSPVSCKKLWWTLGEIECVVYH